MLAYSKFWTWAVAACLALLLLGALFLPRSFALMALSDWIQCILLLSGMLALIPNALRSSGRVRAFWSLLAMGMFFWFAYQVVWTYFEVWLHQDVPDLCVADIVLFLHIVPMMGALTLRPHAPEDEYSARLRRLDFALMMFWWMYLYVFAVTAWQYVVANVIFYDNNLTSLYQVEKLAFLTALLFAWINGKGGWRTLYANLFGASLIYAAGSYLANSALARQSYYSGSLYDIPLAASMAWITIIGLRSRDYKPEPSLRKTSTSHGVWLARLGMIAVFSLPGFAAWALAESGIPPRIRSFRLVFTLVAALSMGIMVFVRQRLLDRELLRLLAQARESFENLKRLQAQITESEKLASVGQLVGGAAHELNNPLTAMMGYCDLLQGTALNPDQKEITEKIGQRIRRTRSLVGSLLAFAKQGVASMAPVDLRTVLRTSVKLTQPLQQALQIEVLTDLPRELPFVMADSNQLLQVCTQILNDALHAADQCGQHKLTLSARCDGGIAIIQIFGGSLPRTLNVELPESAEAEREAGDSASLGPLSEIGMSACQGILHQHHGEIYWQNRTEGEFIIRVDLPVIAPESENAVVDEYVVGAQPQPSA